MPELPEIETYRVGLASNLKGLTISAVSIFCFNLRYPIQPELKNLVGLIIKKITRRGKYLLFHIQKNTSQDGGLLWHLGMSGSLRLLTKKELLRRHDHIQIVIGPYYLIYNDPRRFGFVELVEDFITHSTLRRLGPEPLSQEFSKIYLYSIFQKKRVNCKCAIMDQQVVVGVGNIYANEALFEATINPRQLTYQLSLDQCATLVYAIKVVLKKAIAAGGTTLRDFLNIDGETGFFKPRLLVYGRARKPCIRCDRPLINYLLSQRRTYQCLTCQR